MRASVNLDAHLTHPGVLVVTPDTERLSAVRGLVLARLPAARVCRAANTLEAMRSCLQTRLHLVVVDWTVDDAGGAALIRHLARCRPELPVIACDEHASGAPLQPVTAWAALPVALDRWLLRLDAWLATRDDESTH